jgi:hypothetical protein
MRCKQGNLIDGPRPTADLAVLHEKDSAGQTDTATQADIPLNVRRAIPAFLSWLQRLAAAPGIPGPHGQGRTKGKAGQLACLELWDNPELSDREIARRIGCSPSTLSKNQRYQRLRAALDYGKERFPRASKRRGKDGMPYVEAVAPRRTG